MNARTLLLSIVLPAFPVASLLGQDPPKPVEQKSEIQTDAEALMIRARKLSDIRAQNAPAFRLKAAFSFVGKDLENKQGTYTEVWLSDSQWRREIVVNDSRRIEVGTSNRVWRLDNIKDFPDVAVRLAALMNIFPSPPASFEFDSIADVTDQKPAEQCATTKPGSQQEQYRFCFDRKSGVLLAKLAPDIRPKNMTDYTCFYGIFRKFGDFWFPREMACFEDKHRQLEAKVENLSSEPSPDPALFKPPPGASELGKCSGTTTHSTPTLSPGPGFPTGALSANSSVSLSVVIDIKGKPQQIRVSRSGGKGFDEHAVAAVERWLFKPATCDGEPTPEEIAVEVEFHH